MLTTGTPTSAIPDAAASPPSFGASNVSAYFSATGELIVTEGNNGARVPLIDTTDSTITLRTATGTTSTGVQVGVVAYYEPVPDPFVDPGEAPGEYGPDDIYDEAPLAKRLPRSRNLSL